MKKIILTQSQIAIVDDEYFSLVSKYKWCAKKNTDVIFYAVTNTPRSSGHKRIVMHQLILGKKTGFIIDHINHNGTDNRRCNLRHVTTSQNHQNSRSYGIHSGIYKGVRRSAAKAERWTAYIRQDKVIYYLGSFATREEAAFAYNSAAIKRFGKFACLNIIKNHTSI